MHTPKGNMSAAGVGSVGRGRGFTLIELLVVLGIIALLSSILLVAVRSALSTARVAGEKQVCTAMKTACAQFKQQFGFLPPVIDDTMIINTGGSGIEANQPVLRDVLAQSRLAAPDFTNFFSVNSLAMYLVGAADAKVDGADGPGFTQPKDNEGDKEEGHFLRKGRTYEPLFDVSKDRTRLVSAAPSYQIVDRWGNPFRYYRWEPSYYPANDPDASKRGRLKSDNVPGVVLNSLRGTATSKTVADFPELRDGGFAIVSAGPDRKFGTGAPGAGADPDAVDNIVEIGK